MNPALNEMNSSFAMQEMTSVADRNNTNESYLKTNSELNEARNRQIKGYPSKIGKLKPFLELELELEVEHSAKEFFAMELEHFVFELE